MARLTVKDVENKRPASARAEIPDDYMRGLYFIVQPSGAKSWAVRYRLDGKSVKQTIGPYPTFDLKAARTAAAEALRAVAEGRSPKRREVGTVADAVDRFLAEYGKKHWRPRHLYGATRYLQLYVVHEWGRQKLDNVTRADVRAMLGRIEDAPVMANRVHSIVRKFFNWAVENDLIASSPVTGVRAPNPESSRDRVLTDDELKTVWRAAEREGYPFGPIVQMLILTGQRRSEVGGMMWSEIDLKAGTWTLPRERVKNDRRHEVPLSRQAVAILEQLPRTSDKYVFAGKGDGHFNGFKAKERLDEAAGIEAWTLHDLRRTAASGLAALGVNLTVIEKILNHVSGSLAGIVGVYQRHEFAEEKKKALQQWADHVDQLVRG
jgi:integrase